jgi:4-amino-4-deoxy-L-arabinose transferase-like glycosyltransferase
MRRVPAAAWACAVLACLNAICWSLITPPFQGLDEPDHFAYVQELYETGKLPSSNVNVYSAEEKTVLRDVRYLQVRQFPEAAAVSSRAEQRRLEHDLAVPLSQRGEGDAGVAASEPPLYYALETIPYALGSLGTELDRLQLMRLLSALMAGVTALFAFLFLREALPGTRWPWTVGGLGVALAPLLGEVSGGVNPDALLYAVSAAVVYCLARGFRRGLTTKLAVAISVLTAVGFLTKLNFIGLVPGLFVGLALLALRARRIAGRTAACRMLLLSVVIAISPLVPYVVSNLIAARAPLGFLTRALSLTGRHGSPLGELSYLWQLYLPPFPGMTHDFSGVFTTGQIWFDGFVGLYGWHDTVFPPWVYTAALIPATLLIALLVRAAILCRAALWRRRAELGVYAAMALGMLVLIGSSSYLTAISETGIEPEPRYLLPLVALWGAILALAARGAGRRWGPIAGAVLVLLVLAHDLAAQLLVISRYYPG